MDTKGVRPPTNMVLCLVSIHVLAGHTTVLNALRCMNTNSHKRSQPSQQKPASSQQSRTCWTFARACEVCGAICCDCDYRNQQRKKQKRFSVLRKKGAMPNTKKITTTFGKSLVLIQYRMRYAIYMLSNTKDLAINQTMVAFGNRQNATAFARANNSDLLRSLKHVLETRLYVRYHLSFLLATNNNNIVSFWVHLSPC